MSDFWNQEPFRSLLTAGFGGGLLVLLARIIDKIIPSKDLEMTSEQVFRSSLLERIKTLEIDRDKLANEQAEQITNYWELLNKYTELQKIYNDLKNQYDKLYEEMEKLKKENKKWGYQ